MIRNSARAAVLFVVILIIPSAEAAITLDAYTDGSATVASSNVLTLAGFNATASDKLVVTAGGAASSTPFGVGVTSITYNGVAMNLATRGDTTTSPHRAVAIYYLDKADFAGTGDIVVTFDALVYGINGFDIGAYAISGTATGFDAAVTNNGSGTNGTSATINLAQSGSFVVALNSYGSFNPSAGMTELGGADPLTRAYQLDVNAGSFTAAFTGGNVTAVASFAPIPESSAALLGCISLFVLLRRRR